MAAARRHGEDQPDLRTLYMFMCKELGYTLNSKPQGWALNDLKNCFMEDTGMHPDALAIRFSFPDFEVMIKSKLLSEVVAIAFAENGSVRYMPQEDPRIAHLMNAQVMSANVQYARADKEERDKFNRTLLPENRGLLMEGRKRLAKIVYELGGEGRLISWTEIQDKYKAVHGVQLDHEEMSRLFQRRSAVKVLNSLCSTELELHVGQTAGVFFVRLCSPYADICRNFKDIEMTQERAARAIVPVTDTRRLTSNKFRRRTDLHQADWSRDQPMPQVAFDKMPQPSAEEVTREVSSTRPYRNADERHVEGRGFKNPY